ncbi:transketolase [Gulosibacter macacae]|uniref:Transketolase n=1 Tax=Gulosibacter macacae TaxID=2488791 RepID=A0A3P3VYT4_9MICO|nr:transketolase [Gulosibacter macacae]RRJ87228.1 transketolase [Gulosibacter macacae]
MTAVEWTELDQRAADTARLLAADAVEKAKGGHPGTAMSLAPVAHLLYQHVMRVDPRDPKWAGRDRFILSNGHTSLTQYCQLYLGGFGLELDDLKHIRQWGYPTAGHPEYGHVDHVEMTTGPLGQGLSSAVGFAYAQRYERNLFDPETPEGESPFDHFIYVLAGDGCMQEGVTSEASSLAGHQQLGRLVVIYDSNQISIEDDTDIAFSEDVAKRYESYGWDVQTVDWTLGGTGVEEDVPALAEAIERAKGDLSKPSLIVLKNVIAFPAPTAQNTGASHGAPLGRDEIRATKELLGFDPDADFAVDDEVLTYTRGLADRVQPVRAQWQQDFDAWAAREPERKALWDRLEAGQLPADIEDALPDFSDLAKISTRKASGKVINALAEVLPELWGGSADLAGSNNTTIEKAKSFVPAEYSTSSWSGDKTGRVLHFGIREHAMGAILNGIVLHGRTRAFGGTFLIFSDYMRPPVRLAALMNVAPIFVWTHDSIALGGDGPTHQPVETLTSLRAIPNLAIVRPADGAETAQAWLETLRRHDGPVGLVLSRQDLPVLARGVGDADGDTLATAKLTARGGYVLAEAFNGQPELIIIAAGSEVQLALAARDELEADGVPTRVVSMPSQEWFAEQSDEYRESVLPAAVTARVSVEAGLALTWMPYLGSRGRSVSVETFGASADGDELLERYGITTAAVVAAARESLAAN